MAAGRQQNTPASKEFAQPLLYAKQVSLVLRCHSPTKQRYCKDENRLNSDLTCQALQEVVVAIRANAKREDARRQPPAAAPAAAAEPRGRLSHAAPGAHPVAAAVGDSAVGLIGAAGVAAGLGQGGLVALC